MDAVKKVAERIDMFKLLEYYDFDCISVQGDFIRACCKIHGGNNSTAFVVNTIESTYYCHTGGCGGGDAFTLVQIMEDINFPQSVRWLADFFDVDIKDLEIVARKNENIEELKKFIKVMKAKRKKELKPFYINEEIQEVKKYRKFKEETLHHFNLGYVKKVNLQKKNKEYYTMYNRLVFPIIFKGVQVGISFRRVNNKDVPKWSHQPVDIETRDYLYNYDATKGAREIIVCEGITDVWAWFEVGKVAVATFGAHITDEQYKLLLRTGADLVFSFDGDDAGRTATNKAIDMFKKKANMYVVNFDDGQDPESIDREELLQKYVGKQRV